MDVSSIADTSMNLSLSKTQNAVGTIMLKKTLDYQQSSSESMIQMMGSVPSFGHTLDMLV